jgi:hypothetical protein
MRNAREAHNDRRFAVALLSDDTSIDYGWQDGWHLGALLLTFYMFERGASLEGARACNVDLRCGIRLKRLRRLWPAFACVLLG